jgi:DeoR/GlpR family transcriptional regulator of sugar metabolism
LVETERAMMRVAEDVIVVADSTKFGHQSLAHLAPLDAVQHLVVDDEISEHWQQRVKAAGVNLLIAEKKAADGIPVCGVEKNSGKQARPDD